MIRSVVVPPQSRSGLSISIEVDTRQQKTMFTEIETALANQIVSYMLQHLKEDMKNTLAFDDFYGEALEYMKQREIPFTPEVRDECAKNILTQFMGSLDECVLLDPVTHDIYINPIIFSLEYGDLFRPALQYITKTIGAAIKQMDRMTHNI